MPSDTTTEPQKSKKRLLKKRYYWLAIDLVLAVVIFALLLHKPSGYKLDKPAANKHVSQYLTNELMPQLYNGSQLGEPFELVVSEEGINDIVAKAGWPMYSGETKLYAPRVSFVPDGVVLMGTADIKGVGFVVTVVIKPFLDQAGKLNLPVTTVKIGAINITPVARIIARKMYASRLAAEPVDTDDIRTQIASSLFNDTPFEPVFRMGDGTLRLAAPSIEQKKLTAKIFPVAKKT